jgi:transcriptional regulator with XRE-family HTH domain
VHFYYNIYSNNRKAVSVLPKFIGEQIKDLRVQHELSQEQFAEKVHASRQTVSHWETGRRTPKEDDIHEIEAVFNHHFEMDGDEIEAETPVQEEISAEQPIADENKADKHSVFNKTVPIWLCAAITGGTVLIMLIIMLCVTTNMQNQIETLRNPAAKPYTLAWYQQTTEPIVDQPYIHIAVSEEPIKAVPNPEGEGPDMWFFNITFLERNGIPFEVEEVLFQYFNASATTDTYSYDKEFLLKEWGDNVVPAHGQQQWSGGIPVQAVSAIGIMMKGKDTAGNDLIFKGIIHFSQERAE